MYVGSNKVTRHVRTVNSCMVRVYGVHRTCAKMAAISRGTSHVTIKQRCNHFGGYSKGAV